jgi:hypothetical protein
LVFWEAPKAAVATDPNANVWGLKKINFEFK